MVRTMTTLAALLMLLLAPIGNAWALGVGDQAPQFSATSSKGQVSLVDYRQRQHVVLALYFAVNTPV